MAVFIIFEMLFRPFFPGFQNLYADWANLTVYFSFFILGYIIAENGSIVNAIWRNRAFFLTAACLAAPAFIFFSYAGESMDIFMSLYSSDEYVYELVLAFFRGTAEYSLVMFFTGLASKYLNFSNSFLNYASKRSFGLYMFHYLILSLIMYYLIRLPVNQYILYAAAIILSYTAYLILFELVLSRIPGLRFICGIRKNKKKDKPQSAEEKNPRK
ncbi:acyltransferase [Brucepastera parasyntrophica]|uniref:acyltransferase n=1 Tax=Brucepastera parasyntrophica TaxID=2880008 RepID=UPI00210E6791|nr:acyltransferase [Brucepastera parasyntrophica]ULQ61236.1 acyltransferase [Brucepastera parasyntrophica]